MQIALFIDEQSLEKDVGEKSLVLFEESLKKLGYKYSIIKRPSMKNEFLSSHEKFNLGIPVIHGGYGEGGEISAMLKLLGIPYLFSNHSAHSLCFNKYATNLIAKDIGVAIPKTFHANSIEDISKINFEGPYFIKPNKSGSSIDCGKFDGIKGAKGLISRILCYDSVCIQEAIKGREFTVSLVGDSSDPKVIGIMEIITKKDFFDYNAKYMLEKTKEIFPKLSIKLSNEIKTISTRLYKKFSLNDIARIDYLYANNTLFFLEINTIPGMTPTSFFPQCIKHFGYPSFDVFLKDLIDKKIKI